MPFRLRFHSLPRLRANDLQSTMGLFIIPGYLLLSEQRYSQGSPTIFLLPVHAAL